MNPAFVLLLPDPAATEAERALRLGLGGSATILVPEARGLDFLAAEGELADRLDRWWGEAVPRERTLVYLLSWEPGIEDRVKDLDGEWLIAVPRSDLAEVCERELPNCFPVVTDDAVELARVAVQAFRTAGGAAERQAAVAGLERPPAGGPPKSPWELLAAAPMPAAPGPSLSRRDLMGGPVQNGSAIGASRPGRRAGLRSPAAVFRSLRSLGRPVGLPADAAGLLMARKPLVISVASRKGGTGKTTFAACLGQVFGEIVDPLGGWTLLIDANTTNPDAAWALNLDPATPVATCRDVVTALGAGREPPDPTTFFALRGLAAYPEDRANVEPYTFGEIQAALNKIRRRNLVTVVDLPNMLPDVGTRAGQAVAAWLEESSCVVIPAESTREALMACLEMLDAAPPQTPAVVAYIESGRREIREHSVVRGLLDEIAGRAACVVGVPEDDRIQLAKLDEKPIADASPRLREAYVLLAMEVARHARAGAGAAAP